MPASEPSGSWLLAPDFLLPTPLPTTLTPDPFKTKTSSYLVDFPAPPPHVGSLTASFHHPGSCARAASSADARMRRARGREPFPPAEATYGESQVREEMDGSVDGAARGAVGRTDRRSARLAAGGARAAGIGERPGDGRRHRRSAVRGQCGDR